MLKRIVMQVSGQVMVRFTTAYIQLTICLSRTVKHLLALITQISHSALTFLNPLAQTLSSFKAWVANRTTVVQSIKHVLCSAKAKAIHLGLQLQITAHQTLQRVLAVFKKGN